MKNWTKVFVSAVVVAAVAASGLAISAFAKQQNQETETEAVKASFIGAQETSLEMGSFTAPDGDTTGTTAGMTDEQLDACISDYTAKVERYYALDNSCRETYAAQNEALLRTGYQSKVNYTVAGGVLDCALENVKISDDGNTATANATWTVWNEWVEQNDEGQYIVTAPVNQCTAAITMVKEDDSWKLQKTDALQMTDADAAEGEVSEQAKEICSATYATFTEALDAAKSIDASAVNPFPAL